ncbi:MAG: toprim domain-containing protein [Phycisphaerae bacterium]
MNWTQILSNINIKDLLLSYGIKGRQYKVDEIFIPCPFHSEKEPSCSVNTMKAVFRCFGCGAAGSIVKLIQQLEGITREEAFQKVLSLAGVQEDFEGQVACSQEVNDFISSINNLNGYKKCPVISEDFIKRCTQNVDYTYWIERGFSEDTLRFFNVGFVKEGIYAGRFIIPIYDEDGGLVGFSSRNIDNSEPRYIHMGNMGKSAVLYNLNNVNDHMENSMLITEGFVDTWRAWQYGYSTVVALMGVDLSRDQQRLLTRNTYSVILGLDNDKAGQEATKKIVDKLKHLMEIRVMLLPEGKDIGDLSEEEFKQAIKQAKRVKV